MNLSAVLAGVGVAGVAGLLLMKTSKAAAPVVAPTAPIHPTNDAATFRAPASSGPVTITVAAPPFTGATTTRTITPNPANAATDVARAHTLAGIGHGPGKEGDYWAKVAVVDGATATQLAQLRADGYPV